METPNDVSALADAALRHLRARRYDSARKLYEDALRLHPGDPALLASLAGALHLGGRLPEAISHYVQVLGAVGYEPEVVNNLGVALAQLGGAPGPASAEGGRPADHEAALQLCGLAKTLAKLNRNADASVLAGRAQQLAPNSPDLLIPLASMQEHLGQIEDALGSYRRAAEVGAQRHDVHLAWGLALARHGRTEQALEPLKKALTLAPDHAEGFDIVGRLLEELNRPAEAEEYFQAAIDRGLLDPIFRKALVPIVPQSRAEVVAARDAVGDVLARLAHMPGRLADPAPMAVHLMFNLSYHDAPNRVLKEALCKLLREKTPWLNFEAPHLAERRSATPAKRIRIGFISESFYDHTISWLNQGLIRRLDRQRFHVTVFSITDSQRRPSMVENLADHLITVPLRAEKSAADLEADIRHLREVVAREQLDVLFFTDIGMTPHTLLLAYSRLAPVQATTWGHPDTTGLDTIDYFVSSRFLEPPDAEAQYSEQLVQLDRLPCWYARRWSRATSSARKDLGLPQTGTLYGCPQSLFKFHPDFDPLLAEIAKGDPGGRIVLIEPGPTHPEWMEALKRRWQETQPILLDRVIFLPRLASDKFLQLMGHVDVLLDPIYFGSGNTLYESSLFGTPIVTWPSPFMRGRVVAAAYKQMKVPDPSIGTTPKQYVQIALALGRDKKKRDKLRRRVLARADALLEDEEVIREFECFFEDAVAAASRGARLGADWRGNREHQQAMRVSKS